MCVWGTNTAEILDRQRGASQTAGEPDDRSHFKSDKHSEWMMTFIVIYEVSDFLAVWLLLWPVLIGRGCFSFSLRRSVFHSHQHCTNIKTFFLFVSHSVIQSRKIRDFICHVPSRGTLHQPITHWQTAQTSNFILKTAFHVSAAIIINRHSMTFWFDLSFLLKWMLVFIKNTRTVLLTCSFTHIKCISRAAPSLIYIPVCDTWLAVK